MYRFAYNQLKDWKKTERRKPLIVRGARQVGKTWLLKEFARTCFKNSLYVINEIYLCTNFLYEKAKRYMNFTKYT